MKDAKELIPSEKGFIPEVVDESGKKIVGPELEAVTQLVTQMAQLAQLAKIRKSLEKEEFEGKIDTRTLSASSEVGFVELVNDWPYTPWATANFHNDGPDTVYIGINSMNPYATLNSGDDFPADFTKADRRIEIIYYWTNVGESATTRVVGKY